MQRGDTVQSIAQYHNVEVQDLVEAVKQCIPGIAATGLVPSQTICIPPYSQRCRNVIKSDGVEGCMLYGVEDGDMLESIGQAFNSTATELADINGDIVSAGRSLRSGTRIRLPPWSSSCPNPTVTSNACRVHYAGTGEYLYGLSLGYSVSLQSLQDLNRDLPAHSMLSPGQRVKIPPFTGGCGDGKAATPDYECVTDCRAYRIVADDSLDTIARRFDQSAIDIVTANPSLSSGMDLPVSHLVRIAPWSTRCMGEGLVVRGR